MNADRESACSTSNTSNTGCEKASREQHLSFAPPSRNDGKRVFDLIRQCPPLDTNSVYCNLLQCHHFAATSVKVEPTSIHEGDSGTHEEHSGTHKEDSGLLGFVSGYIPPQHENTLFVWQVAVSEKARGMNLGVRMIRSILARQENAAIKQVHTTITPDNDASWGLFKKLARELDCGLESDLLFSGQEHFGGGHKDEVLVSIGPFSRKALAKSS